jgi:histidinol-phosphate/aromatic aminotransferase/cobyric acid decarboxylase-like protein/GNAT superfamily N-acetyltransferase
MTATENRERASQHVPPIQLRVATDADREAIYRLRHDVYAAELGQHHVNDAGQLRDRIDAYNMYIVALVDDAVVGCIAVTPPPPPGADRVGWYSIEKYRERSDFDCTFDDGLFEIRLLTIAEGFRGSRVTSALLHAMLRWVESQGAREVIGMGRREVMPLYRRIGFEIAGPSIVSGSVRFEPMLATLESMLDKRVGFERRIRQHESRIIWDLDIPFWPADDACYHGGAFFEAIGEDFATLERRDEVINADVLDAWFPPSPRVLEKIERSLPWLLRTSPPTQSAGLIDAIARHRGVPTDRLLVGGGSSDLIYLALTRWLTASSRVLILDPMYGEYAHVLENVVGCEVDRFFLDPAAHYDVDTGALRDRIANGGYDLVILVNPNSPTGRYVGAPRLQQLLAEAPTATRFWVDETYIEYVGSEESLERFAASTPNVVVCKSMSKVYALSGARVAYLCGPRELVFDLRRMSPPWAVGLLGQVAGVEALADADYYASMYAATHANRAALQRALENECGLEVVDSVASFLLCHIPDDRPTAADIVRACREHDVFLRDAGGMGTRMGARALRVAVKDEHTNSRIVAVLREALERR